MQRMLASGDGEPGRAKRAREIELAACQNRRVTPGCDPWGTYGDMAKLIGRYFEQMPFGKE